MEFNTYLIDYAANKWVRFLIAAIILLLAGLIIAFVLQDYTMVTILFGVGIVLIVVFAVIRKGDIQVYGVSKNKLVITPEVITIAGKSYDIKNIKDLRFTVHSYEGMNYKSGHSLQVSNGMNNHISFKAPDGKVRCNFFLNSAAHVKTLAVILKEFYVRHIPFVEMDLADKQTYILQRLTAHELEEFKRKYGYGKKGN